MKRLRVRLIFAWYDLWIGVFIDRPKQRVFIFPMPCVGLVIERAVRERDGLEMAIEMAYGILWRDHSRHSAEKSVAARKTLLKVLTKDGQKRGIEYAIDLYGPTTEAEILESGE